MTEKEKRLHRDMEALTNTIQQNGKALKAKSLEPAEREAIFMRMKLAAEGRARIHKRLSDFP